MNDQNGTPDFNVTLKESTTFAAPPLVEVHLELSLDKFPKIAERLGLAIAEEEHGMSPEDAAVFAQAFGVCLSQSFEIGLSFAAYLYVMAKQ